MAVSEDVTAGTLILAATPIGEVDDASPRLLRALAGTEIIAAEDTRRLRRLAHDLGVRPVGRIVSYYDAVERRRTEELVAELVAGHDVLLVTDAGLPGVSDPGYRLVTAAVAAGVAVTVLPGPSAVTAALVVSGLPADRFCFEGFLPRRPAERAGRLAELAGERRTMVFYEAPHRLAAALEAMAGAFGADRRASVCRELTKTYEEVRRGGLADLAAWAAEGVRGEITVVVAGASAAARSWAPDAAATEVTRRMERGEPRAAALAAVVRESGLPRRVVYDALVRRRHGEADDRPGG